VTWRSREEDYSGTRKMFMLKQKLHTHEEVFKDHVSGQYDESGLVRSIKTM
jgi:hypothetical protein